MIWRKELATRLVLLTGISDEDLLMKNQTLPFDVNIDGDEMGEGNDKDETRSSWRFIVRVIT